MNPKLQRRETWRRVVYRTRRTCWLATSWMRPLPDFLIIGVQKGGTTSLYNYLTQHPQVAGAIKKQLHFFNNPEVFGRGVYWYRSYFPRLPKRDPRAPAEQRVLTGEASPNYMFHPHVPAKVHQVIPGVKLIAILRNPIDRAFSHYKHEMRIGLETAATFEEALEQEKQRLHGDQTHMILDDDYYSLRKQHYYLARGIYVDQLRRWLEWFPRDQLLAMSSDELFDRPAEGYQRVLTFLGLPDFVPASFGAFNAGGYSEDVHPATRQRLAEHFGPYNEQLYELLGVDFQWR